jgi:hypothetical protein
MGHSPPECNLLDANDNDHHPEKSGYEQQKCKNRKNFSDPPARFGASERDDSDGQSQQSDNNKR